jgi:hypothetical protein
MQEYDNLKREYYNLNRSCCDLSSKIQCISEAKSQFDHLHIEAVIDYTSTQFAICKTNFDIGECGTASDHKYVNLTFTEYYDEQHQIQQISNFKQNDYMKLINHNPQQCTGIIVAYKLCYNTYMHLTEVADADGNYMTHCPRGGDRFFINLKIPFRFIQKDNV